MNETLTVFMISEIERLREEGRELTRRIYHNMLRTLRELSLIHISEPTRRS